MDVVYGGPVIALDSTCDNTHSFRGPKIKTDAVIEMHVSENLEGFNYLFEAI